MACNDIPARHECLFSTHAAARSTCTPVCAVCGRLAVPTIVIGELYAGAFRHPDPKRLLHLIDQFLREVDVLDFDIGCAKKFGELRGESLKVGAVTSTVDLMIASVALVHDLTLVTHNVRDFERVPGLRVVDWLQP